MKCQSKNEISQKRKKLSIKGILMLLSFVIWATFLPVGTSLSNVALKRTQHVMTSNNLKSISSGRSLMRSFQKPLNRHRHNSVTFIGAVPLFASVPSSDEEEFFNLEPDDSDLAQLGEEFVDLEVDEDVIEGGKVASKLPTGATVAAIAAPLGFAAPNFDDDFDDRLLSGPEDDEDELDIAFDGDDEEDDNIVVQEEIVSELFIEESENDDDYDNFDEQKYNDDDAEDEWEEGSEEDDAENDEYELQDDADPNYMIQKRLVEERMAKLDQEDMEMAMRERQWAEMAETLDGDEENFEDYSFVASFDEDAIESGEDDLKLTWSSVMEEKVQEMVSKNDLVTVLDSDVEEMENSFLDDSDESDPYANADKEIDEELEKLEFQRITQGALIEQLETLRTSKYDKNTVSSNFMNVNHVAEIGMENIDAFRDIPENIKDEIRECMMEMGSASYNVTKWFVYDLDFNVTNLMLAACQHNPKAPILFEHWFPQLQVCERYQYVRDGNFSFTWEDSQKANMEELYTYYRGFGYDQIPEKAPGETGIIDLEELDEDELQMVDFAAWCQEVYNPEWDRKDFDDDDIRDVDNVFSPTFILPQDPDLPSFQDAKDDIRNWYGEIENNNNGDVSLEQAEYRDMVGQEMEYKYMDDKEFAESFRGHLVVACTPEDDDLEIAEKITKRFDEEFGKQIFVETRVISHALKEDNCFEIWLESYDIELLHSKKRATTGAKDWNGSIECDDDVINRMVERVAFLISDDVRYSYRMDMRAILN